MRAGKAVAPFLNLFILAVVLSFFATPRANAAAAAPLPISQDRVEAAVARIERLQKEAHQLIGSDFWPIEQVNRRIAELRDTLRDAGGESAGFHQNRDIPSLYREAVNRLIQLYEGYRAFVEDLSVPDPGEGLQQTPPAPPYSIAYYDEQRDELERVRKRFEDSAFLLKMRIDEVSARISAVKKQRDTLRALERTAAATTPPNWQYELERVNYEIDTLMLMTSSLRLSDDFSYSRRMADLFRQTSLLLQDIKRQVDFSESDLHAVLLRTEKTIQQRQEALNAALEKIESTAQDMAVFPTAYPPCQASATGRRGRRSTGRPASRPHPPAAHWPWQGMKRNDFAPTFSATRSTF